jgi:hypothetical protein
VRVCLAGDDDDRGVVTAAIAVGELDELAGQQAAAGVGACFIPGQVPGVDGDLHDAGDALAGSAG